MLNATLRIIIMKKCDKDGCETETEDGEEFCEEHQDK